MRSLGIRGVSRDQGKREGPSQRSGCWAWEDESEDLQTEEDEEQLDVREKLHECASIGNGRSISKTRTGVLGASRECNAQV